MTLIQLKNKNLATRDGFVPSIFSDFFNDYFNGGIVPRGIQSSVPAVNISENANEFSVELAVPGMQKSDFHLEVENGLLTISAEKKEEKKDENAHFTRREFSYSSFSRSFTLPESVNPENISAAYENGVLALTLPKKEESKTKPVKEIKIS